MFSAVKANYSNFFAIDEITNSILQANIQAKGLSIMSHITSFEYKFALLNNLMLIYWRQSNLLELSVKKTIKILRIYTNIDYSSHNIF